MIPAHVRDFLKNHHFMTVASRNEQLQLCVIRAFGMKVHSESDQLKGKFISNGIYGILNLVLRSLFMLNRFLVKRPARKQDNVYQEHKF